MRLLVYGENVCKWIGEACGVHPAPDHRAVALEIDGILVAGAIYTDFTGASIGMHVRIDDPRKVSKEWMYAIFDYPFNQLGVNRITTIASTGNLEAQKINKKAGFKEEARLIGYFKTGDAILYCMRPIECKWLNINRLERT